MAVEDPIETVKRALVVRDAGQQDEAAQILVELLKDHPKVGAAYYELAFIQRLQGKHREAVRTLDDAYAQEVVDSRLLLLNGHMLHAASCHDDADERLNQINPSSDAERQNLNAFFDFGNYLRCFPSGRVMVMLDRLKNRLGWLDTPQVADRIHTALQRQEPFSLIRLGDGEGGMLTISQQDEAAYQALYRRNRDELIKIWFGPDFRWQEGAFWKQAQCLPAAISRSDIIGVPYESWVTHEFNISSLRGVPSLVNVFRHLLYANISGSICSQHVHLDLFRGEHLIPIIASAKTVHIITCMPEIRDALIARLGAADIILHLVPAEQGSKLKLGPNAVPGIHFPDVFEKLIVDLSKPLTGELFLVAAGLLGKFYCDAVKLSGGIALDIGSLVDAWLERGTRPGYNSALRL